MENPETWQHLLDDIPWLVRHNGESRDMTTFIGRHTVTCKTQGEDKQNTKTHDKKLKRWATDTDTDICIN